MFHQFERGLNSMINFKDLDDDVIDRLQELIVDNNPNKSAYLLSRSSEGYSKLDLGERIYLDYFLCFEKDIVDYDGNNVNVKTPYCDKSKENTYQQLFNIMKAKFELGYRSITDNNSLEYIFVNEYHKSLIYVEMNSEDDSIMQTKLILPLSKNNSCCPSIEIFNNVPRDLYGIIDKHHPKDWPFIPLDHSPYFATVEEFRSINEREISDADKNRMFFTLDMKKLSKLKNFEKIVGVNNELVVRSITLNSDKSSSKKMIKHVDTDKK